MIQNLKTSSCVIVCLFFSFLSNAQQKDVPFTVDKGIIYCEQGVPEAPRWFADSRLAFQFDEMGISQIDYYNDVPGTDLSTLFLRQLWDGFRYYVEQDTKTFKPEYKNCSISPYGIAAEWDFKGAVIRHRVMAIDESIVIQLVIPENIPANVRFKMEFFEAFALTKGSSDDLRFSNGSTTRKWYPWKFSEERNMLEGGVMSTPQPSKENPKHQPFETFFAIAADFPIDHSVRPINPKHLLKSPGLLAGKTYSFVISFGKDQTALRKESAEKIRSLTSLIAQQALRYKSVAENSPVLNSPYQELNDFISLAPVYHESLKIKGYPGAIRAKTSSYWVWGWDGMTSNYATAYWGDVKQIKDMLQFYEKTADPVGGIGHAFDFNMTPNSISALPAQGMYISLLQLYYANTGDITVVRERYPFAKTVFDRIAKEEVGATGFCRGTSLFPDFPEAMKETGNDISGFNNTVFYCAARSMESLSAVVGDKAQQKKARAIIQRFEQNFLKLFYNPEKKFIVSSVDAGTLQQRDSYNTNAIRWESNYCADITDSIQTSSLKFFRENSVTPMGLREIPLWNYAYDGDANQLHSWWPATGEYFMRVINANNDRTLIAQWVKWVSYWTKHLSAPEGISYYIETDEPEFDRWTSLKGTWQGYSMRGWYQAAIHGVVGVGTDAGGLTFYPYDGEEMTLTGLNFMNKKFDIEWKGSGRYIESIEAGDKIIKGTSKLPSDTYNTNERVKITVHRTSINPYPVFIVSGTAIEMQQYKYSNGVITAAVSGAGLSRLKFSTSSKPVVTLKGKKLKASYNEQLHAASVELNLKPGVFERLEIR